ncbi:hypothetical protein KY290_022704 [Solanum tuberosum]|uniref:Uncharacterized protein n=1 Tax=Solanum tuberosum TaxID=4113 RepID=A0ABQ7V582_SOLTU|nr:hypothetical protein KY290_022704 [Solanum tuberosum]
MAAFENAAPVATLFPDWHALFGARVLLFSLWSMGIDFGRKSGSEEPDFRS